VGGVKTGLTWVRNTEVRCLGSVGFAGYASKKTQV
jgi:hypothetical protein